MDETVDYIVIGSGSSGSTIAGRLSEDGRQTVIVLEAGGSDKSLSVQMPAASYLYALGNPRFDWLYRSLPDPTRSGRVDYMPRGKVLGGTSSINGMCYVRGQPEDFDGWAELGCDGWDFSSVLPYFRKSEDNENGASDLHGTGGPLKIANLRVRHPLSDAFLQAWAGAGLPLTEDINAVPQRGMGYLQTNQWRGQRWSASRAFLWEAMKRRRNLAVKTKAQVTRILFDGLRATGVEYVRDAVIYRTDARRGVIVSAGVFNSPQILMLSGIGDEQYLRRHGISPLVDLKGVGKNLQDHPGVTHTVATSMSTYNVENTLFHKAWYGTQWLFFGRGPGTTPDCHLIGFAATGPDKNRANIQYHFGPVGYEFGDAGAVLYEEPAATAFTNLSRPRSRGWVGLRSNDPMDHPAIQPNLLDDERDIGELVDGAKLIRSVFEQPQFSRYVKRELTPGAGVRSDDEWRAYVIEQAAGIFHPAGTCKMGRDEMAVVDSRLRVHGLENLFVADASIMPTVTSANLSANCIMIGEKFADMLKRGQ